MPEISKYDLDLLEIHEKEYYELLKKWNPLVDALKPIVLEILRDYDVIPDEDCCSKYD